MIHTTDVMHSCTALVSMRTHVHLDAYQLADFLPVPHPALSRAYTFVCVHACVRARCVCQCRCRYLCACQCVGVQVCGCADV